MDCLTKRIQDLPAELYDLIFEYTFNCDTETRTIKADYRPPVFLHVDTASREKFAEAYYRTTFYVVQKDYGTLCGKWLRSLLQAHLDMIDRIVIHRVHPHENSCDCFISEPLQASIANFRLRDLQRHLSSQKVWISPEKFNARLFGKIWAFDAFGHPKVVEECGFGGHCGTHLEE